MGALSGGRHVHNINDGLEFVVGFEIRFMQTKVLTFMTPTCTCLQVVGCLLVVRWLVLTTVAPQTSPRINNPPASEYFNRHVLGLYLMLPYIIFLRLCD